MDLTQEPWIPVIRENNDHEMVSLTAIFEEGNRIRDLMANPPQRVSLMRLLICVSQAALDGPIDETDWYQCRTHLSQAAINYLATWRRCFNLYGERPFLQVKNIRPLDNASLDKLDFSLAAGNNAVLFDHAANPSGRKHSSAWCARMLLTFQCYSPGGLIGSTSWANKITSKSSEHAPAIEGSALHTFILGKNLLETIWLNLLTKEIIDELPQMPFGRPVWEHDEIAQGNTNRAVELTNSYLGRLVPLCRAISLKKDQQTFTLANGLTYPKLPRQRETSATVVKRGKGENARDRYIGVDLSRHPWRELPAILSPKNTSGSGGALALSHLKTIKSKRVNIWTGGMAADKGKILDVADWPFTLPIELFNPRQSENFHKGIRLAQLGEFLLKEAIEAWHQNVSADIRNTSFGKAQTYYWALLDQEYKLLLSDVHDPKSVHTQWHSQVSEAMQRSFDHACTYATPRQMTAYLFAKQKLKLKQPEMQI